MSASRLFIAVDVLDFLRSLPPREQRDLLKRFREIAESPARFADFADRHVKILDVHFADKSS
jgi:hypothetical protein